MVATHGFSPRLLFTGLGLTMMLFVAFAAPMLVVYWTLKLWGRFNETHLGALVSTVLSATLMVVIGAAILDASRAAVGPAVAIAFSTGDWFVKDVAPWLGVAVVVWIVGAFLAGVCMPIIERLTDAGSQTAPETQQEEADG